MIPAQPITRVKSAWSVVYARLAQSGTARKRAASIRKVSDRRNASVSFKADGAEWCKGPTKTNGLVRVPIFGKVKFETRNDEIRTIREDVRAHGADRLSRKK